MSDIQNIKEVLIRIKEHAYNFIKLQQSAVDPTYFRYSLSGDIWDENIKWNVQGRVFALKIAYTIGIDEENSIVQCALAGFRTNM